MESGHSVSTGEGAGSNPAASTTWQMIDNIVFGDFGLLPPPQDAKDPDGPTVYNGMFGMCEMEEAARIVVRRCQAADTWAVRFFPTEFLEARNGWYLDLAGFCILIGYGYLRTSYPNGSFIVTPEFVNRVLETKVTK